MATADTVESIIILDCGSTTTRAILIDLVDGHYRFIAKGETFNTTGNSEDDLLIGVREAICQIESITGRAFLDEEGQFVTPEQVDGRGADALLIVANVGQPLRLILAGLSDQISLASARRAVHSAHALIEHVISPETEMDSEQTDEEKLAVVSTINPDAIVLTGGIDGGPAGAILDLASLLTLGCSLIETPPGPQILYAGNASAREQVIETVGDVVPVVALDNVRPSLDTENLAPLSAALDNLYRERMLALEPGLNTLTSWSQTPIVTSSQAFGYVIKYLAHMWGEGHNVLGVDIGGTMTTVASVVGNEFSLVNRPDLGASHSISRVISQAGIENITRWLPVEIDEETARDRLLNKELRSGSLPQTLEDLYLEQAVAREALRLTLESGYSRWHEDQPAETAMCPAFEIVVGTGGTLVHAPQHGQAILILLDAIQPTGITTLWLDATSLAIPVGSLATVHPLAATQVMEGDAFLNLGTTICPMGTGTRFGEVVMRLTITYSDGRTLDIEIPYGSLEVIPLPLGEEASLEARPLKRFDVGAGPGKKRKIERLVGGMMGLIIDARGRPLILPSHPEERLERVQQWFSDVGA
jgi:hypothetical protein